MCRSPFVLNIKSTMSKMGDKVGCAVVYYNSSYNYTTAAAYLLCYRVSKHCIYIKEKDPIRVVMIFARGQQYPDMVTI